MVFPVFRREEHRENSVIYRFACLRQIRFQEVIHFLSKSSLIYENFIIFCDFNIDVNTTGVEVDNLDEFCNLFELTNVFKAEACCTENHKSTIDLFLANRPVWN